VTLDFVSIIGLLLLGGVAAVDGTSVGQFMISRPFVAATLAGWIAGDAAQGAMIGLVLEALQLPVLPVGAAQYPEGGPAAVAAGAAFATSDASSATLLGIVLGAVALEWVGGQSVRMIRTVNVRILRVNDGPVIPNVLERSHRLAIAIDFARGAFLVAGGLAALVAIARLVVPIWPFSDRIAALLILATVVGMLASAVKLLGARMWLAAAGAAVGFAFLALNR